MTDHSPLHIACVLYDPSQTFWTLCGQGMHDEAREQGGIVLSSRSYTEKDHAEELCSYLKQGDVDAVIVAGGQFSINPPATRSTIPRCARISQNVTSASRNP